MLHQTVMLDVPGAAGPTPLVVYAPDNFPETGAERRRPALIICPGGGYKFRSDREREPVALRFAGLGCAAFVLDYAVASEDRWPIPQRQLLAAIDHVRTHCDDYRVDPHAVVVMGFSAGGHLAGCAGTMWNKPEIYRPLKKKSAAFRPDGMVLCYPVVSGLASPHQRSFANLLGDRYEELLKTVSLEKQVKKNSPPAFLWHTADDTTVPVENTFALEKALKAKGVPVETHIYPHGSHGQSLADRTVYAPETMWMLSVPCASWVERCESWLQRNFG